MTKEAKEFIFSELQKVKKIRIDFNPSYEFHEYSNIHFVLIEPKHLNENREVDEILCSIMDEFDSKFTGQNISFITKDSLVKLDKPEMVFVPEINFEKFNICSPIPNSLKDSYKIDNIIFGYKPLILNYATDLNLSYYLTLKTEPTLFESELTQAA